MDDEWIVIAVIIFVVIIIVFYTQCAPKKKNDDVSFERGHHVFRDTADSEHGEWYYDFCPNAANVYHCCSDYCRDRYAP